MTNLQEIDARHLRIQLRVQALQAWRGSVQNIWKWPTFIADAEAQQDLRVAILAVPSNPTRPAIEAAQRICESIEAGKVIHDASELDGWAERRAAYLFLQDRSLWCRPELHFEWSTFIKMATVDPGLRTQIMDMDLHPRDDADECSALLHAKEIVRSIEATIACRDALGEETV